MDWRKKPQKICLAQTPTPIRFLEKRKGVEIWIKEEDRTGFGLSGNKVRKLEYLLKEALDKGVTDVMTCGGVQSNHARATALACRQLGLVPHLLLRGDPQSEAKGNLFIDRLLGASIRFVSPNAYKERQALMASWKEALEEEGARVMVLAEGGSQGVGLYGTVEAFEEILQCERQHDVSFHTVAGALGSGGTHAGLILGRRLHESDHQILALDIYDASRQAGRVILDLVRTIDSNLPEKAPYLVVDQRFVGKGYGHSTPEAEALLRRLAREKGLLLDPVYTAKALAGLMCRIEEGLYPPGSRLLFLHTGGFFGTMALSRLEEGVGNENRV